MASNDRSSYINLYSFEDKADDNFKFSIENKQAKLAVSSASPMEFDASSYSFVKATGAFDLDSRFAALEGASGVADNAADITQLQIDLAAEQVARTSGDTSNANSITAEVNARTAAVQGVQDNVDAEASTARAAESANASAISSEESARIAGVAAEAARAQAAEAALGVRIDNVLSNVDPAAQDSLAELLAAYQAADNSLANSITSALARITTLENQIAALTDP